MEHSYAISVRLPGGQYVTITVTAANVSAARTAAIAMTGGTVSSIRQVA